MTPVSTMLPVTHRLTLGYVVSLFIAALLACVSTAGLVFGAGHLYGNDPDIIKWFRGWDAANLLVGLPVLLVTLWLVRHGSLTGLLLWPGALFYVFYTFALAVIGAPFDVLFLADVLLVIFAAYAVIGIIASIDSSSIQQRFSGVHARPLGGALFAVGLLASAGLTVPVITTLAGDRAFDPLLHAEWIVDYLIGNPVLLGGGVLLWRRVSLGYVVAPGLFFLSGVNGVAFAVSGSIGALMAGVSVEFSVIAIHLVIAATCFALLMVFLRGGAHSLRNDSRMRGVGGGHMGKKAHVN